MECPDGAIHTGTYYDVILEKGERSWAVMSYADVTRKYVKTPLGKNRLIISYIIYSVIGVFSMSNSGASQVASIVSMAWPELSKHLSQNTWI